MMPGRPTKLTPESAKTIIDAITLGAYAITAAGAARVSEETMYEWLRRGKAAAAKLAEDGELTADEKAYLDFTDKFYVASADAEMAALSAVRTPKEFWQAHMTFLERRYPTRWGRRTQHTGADGGPVAIRFIANADLVKLPPEQLRAVAEGKPIPDDRPIHPTDEGGPGSGTADPRSEG